MLSFIVLLVFFILLGVFLFGNPKHQFVCVLLVSILIPPFVFFVKSPAISPHHLFLYLFFLKLFFDSPTRLKEKVNQFPLKVPFFIIIVSLVLSIFYNNDIKLGLYNGFRYFMEGYSYLLLAFICAAYYRETDFWNKMFWPLVFFCLLGLFEFAQGDNLAFKMICKAFPIYDGYFSLDNVISVSRTYRARIFITTQHPTTLGAAMSCLLLAVISQTKNLDWTKIRITAVSLLMLSILYLSGSRTGLICFLFGAIVLFFDRIAFFFKIFAFGVCTFLVVYQANSFVEEFSKEGQGSSITMRQEQLLFSYFHLMKSPIFGNGVRYTSKNIMERDTYNDRVIDSSIGGLESVIFYQLIDYGIFGFSAYFLLYIYIIWYFFKRRKNSYALTGLIISVSFLLFACFSGELGGNNVIAYLLIGYCMGIVYLQEKEKQSEEDSLEIIGLKDK